MFVENLIRQLLSGLSMSMVVFVIAAGLSLIFGTLKVLNRNSWPISLLGPK